LLEKYFLRLKKILFEESWGQAPSINYESMMKLNFPGQFPAERTKYEAESRRRLRYKSGWTENDIMHEQASCRAKDQVQLLERASPLGEGLWRDY